MKGSRPKVSQPTFSKAGAALDEAGPALFDGAAEAVAAAAVVSVEVLVPELQAASATAATPITASAVIRLRAGRRADMAISSGWGVRVRKVVGYFVTSTL
jgi:hypothetical protein